MFGGIGNTLIGGKALNDWYILASRELKTRGIIYTNAFCLASTTCELAAKLIPRFPKSIARVAVAGHNFYGLLSVPEMVLKIKKHLEELQRAKAMEGVKACATTLNKIFLGSVGVFFSCTYALLSTLAAAGYPRLWEKSFQVLRPLGLICLVLSIARQISDFVINQQLLGGVKDPKVDQGMVMHYFDKPNEMLKSATSTLNSTLAAALLRQGGFGKTFTSVCDSIRRQQDYSVNNMKLIMFGFTAMLITKVYPNTVKSMSAQWVVSCGYLMKEWYKPRAPIRASGE